MPNSSAESWYEAKRIDADTILILEPHVHVLEQANMWLVEGRERDMILDTGMGVVPLRPFLDGLRRDPDKPIVCVCSHTHIDHIGAAHDAGYPPIGEMLIEALPHEGYDPESYRLQGAPATGLLQEGDTLDLGGHLYEVLHLPGHSPGGIGLFERGTGVLFAADAIYDGPLIYDGPGMSVAAYRETFSKLRTLPVTTIHGGHDPSFDRDRMLAIIAAYEARWDAEAAASPEGL
jgi:glyoxylase-like metal-dependent hydrolase (beta-lactamase superfamily II)